MQLQVTSGSIESLYLMSEKYPVSMRPFLAAILSVREVNN